MAVRYRDRLSTDESWSNARRLWRLMRRVRRFQRHRRGPYYFRRRDLSWGPEIRGRWVFLRHVRERLEAGKPAVYQVRVGDGAVLVVQKYRQPPRALSIGEQVIAAAKECLGAPYVFGEANGPEDPGRDELDCSGLTQYAWGTVGVFLPHAARLQQVAPNVDTFTDERLCQPGDLVLQWFENSRGIPRGQASHVGLWISPGKEIDTRSPSKPVAIRNIEPGSVIGFGRPGGGQQQ